MKVLILLEFGIPPYREFLFNYLNELPFIEKLTICHTGQRFDEGEHNYDHFHVKTHNLFELTIHRGILKQIRTHDLIISSFNIYRPMCWLPMLFTKKPWIIWGPGFGRNKLNLINRLIRKPFINLSSKFIVYTEEAKQDLIHQWGIEASKLSVANNTLNVSNADCSTCQRKYLLYVGRLQERKGLEKVLTALHKLKQRDIVLPFVILGDGEIKDNLQLMVKELDMQQQVSFRPATFNDSELKEVFSSALAYVSPGHVGLGVVHSFAYGIPVLTCSKKDHAREFTYCTQENSFLYEEDDHLEKVLERLATHPDESFQKGRVGYKAYTENLSHHHMNKVFSDAIDEALK